MMPTLAYNLLKLHRSEDANLYFLLGWWVMLHSWHARIDNAAPNEATDEVSSVLHELEPEKYQEWKAW